MGERDRLERRVEHLESVVAFQEQTISALDEVVRAFTLRVEHLEREVERARAASEADREVGPQDDPPPHY